MSVYLDGSLMPPPFASGLSVWSKEDGTPGSATWAGDANAALVPADADFGGCLELVKTQSVQKLRYMTITPIRPGSYLRVRAKVKAISGALPSVRIAGWAGTSSGAALPALPQTGPSVALTAYGTVVEVSAVIGIGARAGVDMVWRGAARGYLGLDLTGANGGVVRIDDLIIEEVGLYYAEERMGTVDVRDFGAVGDGTTDDRAAFLAADAAAKGRLLLVPTGTYRLSTNTTLNAELKFDGQISLPATSRLILKRSFDLPTYIDAFGGDEMEGFRRAIQALLNWNDHVDLDMCGRRIEVTGPIDIRAAEGVLTTFESRRVIRNGQFNLVEGAGWTTGSWTSTATYAVANPKRLSAVANVANIEVGSLVSGAGVGREVYVTAKNVAQGTLTLSQPLYGAAASQSYTFKRFRYALDFSGFEKLSKFELDGVEINCNGIGSGILLAGDGETFQIRNSTINRPKDRGITSHGGGCQDLQIDGCHFNSNEMPLPIESRTTVAFNINSNDGKIRNNRFQRFRHTGVLFGSGHIITNNHLFQGEDFTGAARVGGLIFTLPNCKSHVVGNYIDNCSVEMTNEHDAAPGFSNEFSFGGLSITGNQFTMSNAANWSAWLVVKPYGAGHFLHGLSVIGNVFKCTGGTLARVEKLDNSISGLNFLMTRNVTFTGNTFNGIDQLTINPAVLEFQQASPAANWVLNTGAFLPFGGLARTVSAVVSEGPITNAAGQGDFSMPYVTPVFGDGTQVRLTFGQAVKGKVRLTVRADNPA